MALLFRILAILLMLLFHKLHLPLPVLRLPTPSTKVATATAVPAASPTTVPTHTAPLAPTWTPTETALPSATPTATFTSTAVPSHTSVPTSTSTPTSSPTATHTATAPPVATLTSTPSPIVRRSDSDPTGFDVVGVPPAQKLPSAMLIYPLVQASATQDTRIELLNLTASTVSVQCFYVRSVTCSEVDFFVTLTANQPVAWKASTGAGGSGRRLAPPFLGEGELKCVVLPRSPDLSAHNALQGRALVSDSAGQTIGYSAIAFRRLSPGDFTGIVSLDGVTYEQCPDRLHFNVLASQTGSDSEIVLVPCEQDLLNQVASSTTVQFAVINELEQQFSAATSLRCFDHRRFSGLGSLRRSAIGTDTAHVIVRGTDVPVVGLVIDRFTVPGSSALSTSSNEPNLEGGRSATVNLP